MDKGSRLKWAALGAAILLAAEVIAVAAFSAFWHFSGSRARFEATDEVFGNPMMGYAPRAEYDEVLEDVTLLYVDVTWREWEPERGVYDRQAIAEENQLGRWRAEGRHIVLRFVCDLPGAELHRDIPDWLYEECGGQDYDMVYGKGCSPHYDDERMVVYHAQAVQALGEWLGDDSFVAYIELGSLGHWGEWHVNRSAGIEPLPDEAVRDAYVEPWLAAFPHAKLLMRRPFSIAAREGLGVYNDMTGEPDDTEEWLGWLANGGAFSQTGEENALTAMPQVWKTAPVGGEFTSSIPMEELLGTQLGRTLALVERSHVTFLGPKTAKTEDGVQGRLAVLGAMGYRLGVTQARLRAAQGGTMLELRWQNTGAAPLYWDWPVRVTVYDRYGVPVETADVEIVLSQLQPGMSLTTQTLLAADGLSSCNRAGCTVTLGIIDPMTGEPAVRLTTGRQDERGCMVLFEEK